MWPVARFCFNYLSLWDKSPHNFVASDNHHCVIFLRFCWLIGFSWEVVSFVWCYLGPQSWDWAGMSKLARSYDWQLCLLSIQSSAGAVKQGPVSPPYRLPTWLISMTWQLSSKRMEIETFKAWAERSQNVFLQTSISHSSPRVCLDSKAE